MAASPDPVPQAASEAEAGPSEQRRGTLRGEIGATASMAAPLILAQLLQVGMGFVDTVMAGRVSALDLAAVALGSNLWVLIFLGCVGLLQAMSPTIAQLCGGNRHEAVPAAFHQGLWIALGLCLLSFFLTRWIGGLLPLFGVEGEVVTLTRDYLDLVSWGMPGICLYLAGRYLHEGFGHTRPLLVVQLLLLPLNIFGNWVFMFGKFGFPAMGALGAAVSTAIGLWLGAAMMLYNCQRSRTIGPLQVFARISPPDWLAIWRLLRLGAPIAASILMETSLFSAVALLMAHFGPVAVAAHQVAINYAGLMFMIPLGFGLASTVRVGHAVGADDLPLARRRGWIGIGLGAAAMLASALLMLAAPELIAAIYTDDPAVIELAVTLLFVAALFQLSDGLQIAAAGALRGLKDTTVPMLVSLLAYWIIGLPAAWLIGLHWGGGPSGLWVGLIIGLSIAAVLLNWRFHRMTLAPPHAAGSEPDGNGSG